MTSNKQKISNNTTLPVVIPFWLGNQQINKSTNKQTNKNSRSDSEGPQLFAPSFWTVLLVHSQLLAFRVVDLARKIQAAKPWFHQYVDPAWYHLWRILSEDV